MNFLFYTRMEFLINMKKKYLDNWTICKDLMLFNVQNCLAQNLKNAKTLANPEKNLILIQYIAI